MTDSEDRTFDWAEYRAFDWAEYRKDYQPNPSHFDREAIAFRAGWNAANSRAINKEAKND